MMWMSRRRFSPQARRWLSIAWFVSLVLLLCGLAVSAIAEPSDGPAPPAAAPSSDAELQRLIEARVREQKWATGIVLGITRPGGRRVLSHGTMAADDRRPVDARTVFEIASLTKVFTALLMVDMERRRQIDMEAPVSACLPQGAVSIPERDGRKITFIDLATHTSGLPLRPPNLRSQTASDKYAGYTAEQMYAALSSHALDRDVGGRFEYSNWGYGLLGHALARCAHKDYGPLIRQRITAPLGMNSTLMYPTPAMRKRMAVGHDSELVRVANAGHGVLDPAGSLYSTADDLMTFLELFLERRKSGVGAAAGKMLDTARPTEDPQTQIALGWRISTHGDRRIVWSNGRADGYRSYMGYDPQSRVGVVALANAATNMGVDDIAQYVLDPTLQPVRAHPRVDLSVELLERCVGRYRFDDGKEMTITRVGGRLISQMTEQGPAPLYAAGESTFHPEDIEARIEFDPPSAERRHARTLTLYQDGNSWHASRVD
jgi:D-alanyl-D-alanine-carboxypeptidase/D-alanyl-D-alanine-endopeptidase